LDSINVFRHKDALHRIQRKTDETVNRGRRRKQILLCVKSNDYVLHRESTLDMIQASAPVCVEDMSPTW